MYYLTPRYEPGQSLRLERPSTTTVRLPVCTTNSLLDSELKRGYRYALLTKLLVAQPFQSFRYGQQHRFADRQWSAESGR